MRTLLLLAYRVILIVILVSFFSFAALDQPVLRQLYAFLTLAQKTFSSHFDFLFGFSEHRESLGLVARAYGRSMILLLGAVAVGSTLGLALGLISGLWPRSPLAALASIISYVGIFTPSFLLALLLLLLFVRYISPAVGIRFILIGPGLTVFDPRRLLVPVVVLSVRPLALVTQLTIGSLQEVIHSDYVRTARAKGLMPRTVLLRHMLRNIAVPVLTGVNSSFYYSLSSLLVVEWLFGWQGVGLKLLDAMATRNAEMASYLLVSVGVTFLLVNTALKAAMNRLDPRLTEAGMVVS